MRGTIKYETKHIQSILCKYKTHFTYRITKRFITKFTTAHFIRMRSEHSHFACNIHLNIILPSMLMSFNFHFPLMFSNQVH